MEGAIQYQSERDGLESGPPLLPLPDHEEVEADLRRHFEAAGIEANSRLILKLTEYVLLSRIETVLLRQPLVAPWLLPEEAREDIQNSTS